MPLQTDANPAGQRKTLAAFRGLGWGTGRESDLLSLSFSERLFFPPFIFFFFFLLITYPKGEELNLYNSRDFMFTAHQPNPLTDHRKEQRRCPRQENPAAYQSFDSNVEAPEVIFLVPVLPGEEASFLHHPQPPVIISKLNSSTLYLSASA